MGKPEKYIASQISSRRETEEDYCPQVEGGPHAAGQGQVTFTAANSTREIWTSLFGQARNCNSSYLYPINVNMEGEESHLAVRGSPMTAYSQV